MSRRRPTAAERIINVLSGKSTITSRVRMLPPEIALSPRHVLPTGIFEISVGLSKSDLKGRWWNVVLYYMIGESLVCRHRSVNMTRMSADNTLKQLTVSEIMTRPHGEGVQRLYKKHDEYKIIQEILKDVFKQQRVEKASRDADAEVVADAKGSAQPEPDSGTAEAEPSESDGASDDS